jgi:hypothetical protein
MICEAKTECMAFSGKRMLKFSVHEGDNEAFMLCYDTRCVRFSRARQFGIFERGRLSGRRCSCFRAIFQFDVLTILANCLFFEFGNV